MLSVNLFYWVSSQFGVGSNCQLTLYDMSDSPISSGIYYAKNNFLKDSGKIEGSRTLILDSARCIPIKTDRQHYIYVYVRELLT